tara:strand:- start:2568 stop:2852 length:285 start_codon:yes stop_codon:yes gene_type:complete
MNTTEENKLIAEFMGLPNPEDMMQPFLNKTRKYSTSWKWLIPVIKKMKDDFNLHGEVLDTAEGEELVHGIEDAMWDNKIEDAHTLVVEYLQENK